MDFNLAMKKAYEANLKWRHAVEAGAVMTAYEMWVKPALLEAGRTPPISIGATLLIGIGGCATIEGAVALISKWMAAPVEKKVEDKKTDNEPVKTPVKKEAKKKAA